MLAITDNKDGKRVFNSIDASWRNKTDYTITFRPDKCEIAYEFRNSIASYIQHLHPDADLTSVLTYEALVQAQEESYDPETQQFTTKNDEEIVEQYNEFIEDDFNEWIELPDEEINMTNVEITNKPKQIIGAKKLFDLSGENDTVSTFMPDSGSVNSTVSFSDIVDEHNYVEDQPVSQNKNANSIPEQGSLMNKTTNAQSNTKDNATVVSSISEASQEARILQMESSNKKLQSDLKEILTLLKNSNQSEKASPTNRSGDAGNK